VISDEEKLALHYACENVNISPQVIKILAENTSNLNEKERTESTPIHVLLRNENISFEKIKYLGIF
jgi:ankyrin repeat protein